MATLKAEAKTVCKQFAPEINKLYPGDTYRPANYLKEVQDYIGAFEVSCSQKIHAP